MCTSDTPGHIFPFHCMTESTLLSSYGHIKAKTLTSKQRVDDSSQLTDLSFEINIFDTISSLITKKQRILFYHIST